MARRSERGRRAAAGSVDRMQVDVVRHLVVGVIVEMHLDLVALADANELARHMPAERPERIADAVGKPPFELPDFQMHHDLRRMLPVDRRRNVRRVGQSRVLLADNGIVEVILARCPESGPGDEDRSQRRA